MDTNVFGLESGGFGSNISGSVFISVHQWLINVIGWVGKRGPPGGGGPGGGPVIRPGSNGPGGEGRPSNLCLPMGWGVFRTGGMFHFWHPPIPRGHPRA